MHRSKIPVLILVITGLVGCFLPWADTLQFAASSCITGLCFTEGGITLTALFLLGVLTLIKTRTADFLNSFYKTAIVLSSIVMGITLFQIFEIKAQTARIMSYEINVEGITKYHPAYGLYISMIAAATILLYAIAMLLIRYRKVNVTIPANWLKSEPSPQAGRFYIPAHHNTTL